MTRGIFLHYHFQNNYSDRSLTMCATVLLKITVVLFSVFSLMRWCGYNNKTLLSSPCNHCNGCEQLVTAISPQNCRCHLVLFTESIAGESVSYESIATTVAFDASVRCSLLLQMTSDQVQLAGVGNILS